MDNQNAELTQSSQPAEEIPFKSIWAKRDDEPDNLYDMFSRFIDMGPTRSYAKMAKRTGYTKQTIYNWSKKFNWMQRAEAYDRSQYLELKSAIIIANEDQLQQNVENNMVLAGAATEIVRSLIQHFEFNGSQCQNDFVKKRLRYLILCSRAIKEVQSLVKFLPFTNKNDLSMESLLIQYLHDISESDKKTPFDIKLVDSGVERPFDKNLDLGYRHNYEPLGSTEHKE